MIPQPHFTSSGFYGLLTQKGKEAVLKEVAEEANRRFMLYMQAVEDATGIKQLRGEDRRNAYSARPNETWTQMQAQFPKEYERQMRDWAGLELNAEKRIRALYPSSPGASIVKSPKAMRAAIKTTRDAAADTSDYLPLPSV